VLERAGVGFLGGDLAGDHLGLERIVILLAAGIWLALMAGLAQARRLANLSGRSIKRLNLP
jgi:hypothetical protein